VGDNVPKLIPVPDELSEPFWDAVNERRLVVQHCIACNTLQYPPRPACQDCGSNDLDWKETNGRGHILEFVVLDDSHLPLRAQDQPVNLALVTLDEDPRINFYANLPSEPVREVPVGAAVEVIFEEAAPGRLVHEWRVVT
jgi:uncharacterized OB-fold protein